MNSPQGGASWFIADIQGRDPCVPPSGATLYPLDDGGVACADKPFVGCVLSDPYDTPQKELDKELRALVAACGIESVSLEVDFQDGCATRLFVQDWNSAQDSPRLAETAACLAPLLSSVRRGCAEGLACGQERPIIVVGPL
jgi:hypothetical protein